MQGSISEAKASTENTEAVVEHISNEDSVTREAIGGASVADLPKGYYRSYKFIGTFLVSSHSYLFRACGLCVWTLWLNRTSLWDARTVQPCWDL